MSLIINMLKDLEKRESVNRDKPEITLFNDDIAIASRYILHPGKNAIYFLILIAIVSTILFISSYFSAHQSTPSVKSIQPVIDNVITNKPDMIDTIWTSPVLINGVTLQVKDNITELTFMLSHVALYRLSSDDMQNQISISFDNAKLQSTLPPINYLNTAISRLTTNQVNDSTQFVLTLAPGTSIRNISLDDSKSNPELTISIESPEKSTNQVSQTTSGDIKVPALQSLLSQQYQSALQLAENGDFKNAISQLESLLKADQSFNDARTSLVALLIDQGNITYANQILNHGLKIQPGYIPFVELKARLLSLDGQAKQAIALLENYSPEMDKYPEYYSIIAALYERTNKDLLAINIYHQLLNRNSQNSSWWFGLAVSLDKLGKSKDALNAYSTAMSQGNLNPESLAYLNKRIQALQEGAHETD